MKSTRIFIFLCLIFSGMSAQESDIINRIMGSAVVESRAAAILEKISDGSGGRMVGTQGNERAKIILLSELKEMGLNPIVEEIEIPGWVRGADKVIVESPVNKSLYAVALGYTQKKPDFTAPVLYCASGSRQAFDTLNVKGKIALVNSARRAGQPRMVRANVIRHAAAKGARAVLFINSRPGGTVLAGTGDFKGNPLPIPAFSLTYEEGLWLKRLESREPVSVSVHTESYCKPMKTFNIRLIFPGKRPTRIVVGGHFDSWDLGTGAVDNGIGSAILFDMARLLQKYAPHNEYTIELVWFNGEEWGLWGSKKYVETHGDEDIAFMINLDMTGNPTGFNAMGFSELIPLLENFRKTIPGMPLPRGIISRPWTNSDHMDFMFKGIPVIGILAHLDDHTVSGYHNLTDSFDKVNSEYLSKAAGVTTLITRFLANQSQLKPFRYTREQMIELLTKHKLDERLKAQHEWPY